MLDEKIVQTIKNIAFQFLDPTTDKVFIFGSRVEESARKFSDIDLGIESSRTIDLATISQMSEAYEESNLPYRVDVVDFSTAAEKFKRIAKKNIITLN